MTLEIPNCFSGWNHDWYELTIHSGKAERQWLCFRCDTLISVDESRRAGSGYGTVRCKAYTPAGQCILIQLWPATPASDRTHLWYERDGSWRRICDDRDWPDGDVVASVGQYDPCPDCRAMYADDVVMEGRLAVGIGPEVARAALVDSGEPQTDKRGEAYRAMRDTLEKRMSLRDDGLLHADWCFGVPAFACGCSDVRDALRLAQEAEDA